MPECYLCRQRPGTIPHRAVSGYLLGRACRRCHEFVVFEFGQDPGRVDPQQLTSEVIALTAKLADTAEDDNPARTAAALLIALLDGDDDAIRALLGGRDAAYTAQVAVILAWWIAANAQDPAAMRATLAEQLRNASG